MKNSVLDAIRKLERDSEQSCFQNVTARKACEGNSKMLVKAGPAGYSPATSGLADRCSVC